MALTSSWIFSSLKAGSTTSGQAVPLNGTGQDGVQGGGAVRDEYSQFTFPAEPTVDDVFGLWVIIRDEFTPNEDLFRAFIPWEVDTRSANLVLNVNGSTGTIQVVYLNGLFSLQSVTPISVALNAYTLLVYGLTTAAAAAGGGWTSAALAPSQPSIGDGWFDTVNNELKIFNGTSWAPAVPYRPVVSATAPTSPASGQLWFDRNPGVFRLKVFAVGEWRTVDRAWTSGISAPADPLLGDGWHSTGDDELRIYDGSIWQPVVQDEVAAQTTAPQSPNEGQLWYDTAANQLKAYDGSTWGSSWRHVYGHRRGHSSGHRTGISHHRSTLVRHHHA